MASERSSGSVPGRVNSLEITGGSAAHGTHRRTATHWRRAGAVVLFVILALTALQSARLGTARFLASMAQFEFERWTSANPPVDIREVNRVEKYLSDSLQYASANPWALEMIGALDLARMRASRIPREALAAARDARARFREALLQRPTAPFLWANLALSKLYLDEIDDELFTALRHAGELGPWEPTIQQMTLFVGLAVWPQLDPGLRQGLVRTIERGALGNADKMYAIVKRYRRFDLICGISKYNYIAARECKELQNRAKLGDARKVDIVHDHAK